MLHKPHRPTAREDLFIKALPDITLCLIAKNSSQDLSRCLRSAAGIANQIVLVDTGSSDDTVNIAKQAGAIVDEIRWNDDFAAARNHGLPLATGQWLLQLDADEALAEDGRSKLDPLFNDPQVDAYACMIVDAHTGAKHPMVRLWRNDPAYRYHGKVHEEISVPAEKVQISEITIFHYGYDCEGRPEITNEKSQRNIRILEAQIASGPQDQQVHYYLAQEYAKQGNFEEAIAENLKALEHPESIFSPLAVLNLAICYQELQEFERAIEVLDKGIEKYSDYTDLYFLKALALQKMGAYDDAIRWYLRCINMGSAPAALSSNVDMAEFLPLRGIADCLLSLGQVEKAREVVGQALALRPDDPICHQILNELK